MSLKKGPTLILIFPVLLLLSSTVPKAFGLEAHEILLVANGQERSGVSLAKYYMEQRNIPAKNLLILQTAASETILRPFFDGEVAAPIRDAVAANPKIQCLLLFYGIPLRVVAGGDPSSPTKKVQADYGRSSDSAASVDSELSLVKVAQYPLNGWLPNPYFLQFQTETTRYDKDQVLFVARLDGPDVQVVQRLIDDSLEAEERGLQGTAYFDARWPKPETQDALQGYGLYDDALHQAAEITRSVLPVVLDEKEALFGVGAAKEAALYCGWYSLGKYVDAFTWKQGAVAYHIASSECTTLKKEASQVWCKRLLEEGVAATLGPVGEPYVQAFPLPQIFFGLLVDGDFSLVEAYFLSLPFLSWKMVLIGDPLYQPFRARGVLD